MKKALVFILILSINLLFLVGCSSNDEEPNVVNEVINKAEAEDLAKKWLKSYRINEFEQSEVSVPITLDEYIEFGLTFLKVDSSIKKQDEWFVCMVVDFDGEKELDSIVKISKIKRYTLIEPFSTEMQEARAYIGNSEFCNY